MQHKIGDRYEETFNELQMILPETNNNISTAVCTNMFKLESKIKEPGHVW